MQRLSDSRVVTEDRAWELSSACLNESAEADAEDFVKFLARTGILTSYQSERILTEEWTRLILGPYLILEPFSNSTLGTVYRAQDRDRDRIVAINVLPLRSIWHVHLAKKVVAAFREITPHPGIVPLIDIDTANGFHYLCWPFLRGESIERLVSRRGPLPPADLLRYATAFAEAIANCHRHGIVHGCLHPGNLIILPDESAKVIEWGAGAILSENIAEDESFLDTISTATAVSQNIDFLPPETIAEPTQRTFAADQYAFGCSLYYALTANPPFPDGNFVDKMIAHQTKMPEPLHVRDPRIPEALSQIVQKLMSKRPSDRYADWLEPISLLRQVAGLVSAPTKVEIQPASAVDQPEQIQWDQLEEILDENVSSQAIRKMSARPESSRDRRTNSESEVTFDLAQTDEDTENSFGVAAGKGQVGSTGEIPIGHVPLTPSKGEPSPTPTPSGNPLSSTIKPIVLTGRSQSRLKESSRDLSAAPPPVKKPQKTLFSFKIPSPIPRSRMPLEGEESDVHSPLLFKPKKPRWSFFYYLRYLFLRIPAPELLQISLFGPERIAAGQTIQLQVFAHSPVTFESTKTLARAFVSTSELLATGYADRFVTRGQSLTFHLAVANAGVGKPNITLTWSGQQSPSSFDVHVPWECQTGVTSAILTTSRGTERMSTLPFTLVVESRVAARI
ncbi:MAG: serine/threonine-protein kinase [Gemmataceae bacterium]